MIRAKVLREAGHEEALLGMSLSHGLHKKEMSENERWERKLKVARGLAHKQGGHNKFLESIIVWLDVTAPRYWWQQADTYRISSKQSESTMHTILKGCLEQYAFYEPIPVELLDYLNRQIEAKELDKVKRVLPESFMQRRIWCLSYKTLQNMYHQRINHKLQEWRDFLGLVVDGIEHPEYVVGEGKSKE